MTTAPTCSLGGATKSRPLSDGAAAASVSRVEDERTFAIGVVDNTAIGAAAIPRPDRIEMDTSGPLGYERPCVHAARDLVAARTMPRAVKSPEGMGR